MLNNLSIALRKKLPSLALLNPVLPKSILFIQQILLSYYYELCTVPGTEDSGKLSALKITYIFMGDTLALPSLLS